MRLLFLNGFDRSGSSMIGGLLAKHPKVAYFFQPFNRTQVHSTQYEVWRPAQRFPDTEDFLQGLLEGRVERDYLGADLFDRHSTAGAPQAGLLNIVKETKLHFKADWLQARFPSIELFGIWRDPRGILCSLLRNGFASAWYGEPAFHSIRATIDAQPSLSVYRSCLSRDLADYEQLALVLAARTHLFAQSLPSDRWVHYEQVLEHCDASLNRLTERFGLAPYAFSQHLAQDFNVVGRPSAGADLWRSYFDPRQLERLDALLAPLDALRPPRARATQRV